MAKIKLNVNLINKIIVQLKIVSGIIQQKNRLILIISIKTTTSTSQDIILRSKIKKQDRDKS